MDGAETAIRQRLQQSWRAATSALYRCVRDSALPMPATSCEWVCTGVPEELAPGGGVPATLEEVVGCVALTAGCTAPFPAPRSIVTCADLALPRAARVASTGASAAFDSQRADECPLKLPRRAVTCSPAARLPALGTAVRVLRGVPPDAVSEEAGVAGCGVETGRTAGTGLVAIVCRATRAAASPFVAPAESTAVFVEVAPRAATEANDAARGPCCDRRPRAFEVEASFQRPRGLLVVSGVCDALATPAGARAVLWMAADAGALSGCGSGAGAAAASSASVVAAFDAARWLEDASARRRGTSGSSAPRSTFREVAFGVGGAAAATALLHSGPVVQLAPPPPSIDTSGGHVVLALERDTLALYDSRVAHRAAASNCIFGIAASRVPHECGQVALNSVATWAAAGGAGGGGTKGFGCVVTHRSGVCLWDLRRRGLVDDIAPAIASAMGTRHQLQHQQQQQPPLVASSEIVARSRVNSCAKVTALTSPAWACFQLPIAFACGSQVVIADAAVGGEPIFVHSGHTAEVLHLAPHPTASLILSTSADASLQLWSPVVLPERDGTWL